MVSHPFSEAGLLSSAVGVWWEPVITPGDEFPAVVISYLGKLRILVTQLSERYLCVDALTSREIHFGSDPLAQGKSYVKCDN